MNYIQDADFYYRKYNYDWIKRILRQPGRRLEDNTLTTSVSYGKNQSNRQTTINQHGIELTGNMQDYILLDTIDSDDYIQQLSKKSMEKPQFSTSVSNGIFSKNSLRESINHPKTPLSTGNNRSNILRRLPDSNRRPLG